MRLWNPYLDKSTAGRAEEWKHVLQEVYQHVRTARYLDPLTEKDIYELRKDV